MIQQFKEINFGSYKDFKWKFTSKEYDFNKINIIYGRNYSGKTTLSRIARSFELKNIHKDFGGSSFKISLENGEITEKDIKNQPLNIKVYNSDFVKDNLSYLYDDNGDIKGFKTLGEKNTNLLKEIEELENKLGKKSSDGENASGLYLELEVLEQKYDNIEKDIITNVKSFNNITDKASEIKKNKFFNNQENNYNRRTLERELEEISNNHNELSLFANNELKYLSDDEQIKFQEIIKDDKLNSIIFNIGFNDKNFINIFNEYKTLLSKAITDNSKLNSNIRKWLKDGFEIHSHGDNQQCQFCKNILSKERLEELEKIVNFNSNEKQELEQELEKLKNTIIKNKLETSKLLCDINKDNFYSHFKGEFEENEISLKISIQKYNAIFDKFISNIDKKLENIFDSIEIAEENDCSSDINEILNKIKNLCDDNNAYGNELEEEQEYARKQLRQNEVLKFWKDFGYDEKISKKEELEKNKNKVKNEKDNKQDEITKIEDKIKAKQKELSDLDLSVKNINTYLKSYFGHNALEIEIGEDSNERQTFTILRNKKPAKNLSEGECSLVAFCYFIATLKAEDNTLKPIIWIDDPISSLDNNHIFYIFSLIENEIANKILFEQLFISTHNLDFLKYLKRLEVKKQENENKKYGLKYYFIEKNIHENGETSEIKELPTYLKEYTTEFNYLFKQIYKFKNLSDEYSEDLKATLVYNFGNNLRKFLEIYLFFKYPNNFKSLGKEQIETFFKDTYQDDEFEENKRVIASIINRYQNEYSHLREIPDRGMQPIDIEETKKIASFLLDTMKKNDEKQYNALEDSILSSSDTTTNNEQSKKGNK